MVQPHFCSSFHQAGRSNEGELWPLWSSHGFSALTNGRNTGWAERALRSCLLCPKKPQDASWRRLPPSTAASSLVKGGHQAKAEGKSNFLLPNSPFFAGFLPLFPVYFHKAYNYLTRVSRVRTNEVFVPLSLQPSPVSRKKEVILTFDPLFLQMQQESQMCLLKKNQ